MKEFYNIVFSRYGVPCMVNDYKYHSVEEAVDGVASWETDKEMYWPHSIIKVTHETILKLNEDGKDCSNFNKQ